MQNVVDNWELILSKLSREKEINYILEGISDGVRSENEQVSDLTMNLY